MEVAEQALHLRKSLGLLCQANALEEGLGTGEIRFPHWRTWCKLLVFLLRTFHANGDHADFSLGFFFPLGAILDNAKLILRVQWFVLFGQEVLVQVVHLDAMYFAFWILAREPQKRLFLPPGHNCPSPHFATCKRPTFSGLGRQIKIESHQSQIQKCSLESR